ncbi:DUF2069 domain-containing protein [Amnimonas aquatica]|uniref:DUF2069 domain-containing protein n=1 Tax=Amnimonas aquatica TaxID=2094561 RepID=A0A2P6ARA4_9GAMM|nr:DUF2069 domain-containing protein [Amnimonas aquatica]PQA36523.1 hypothetical protein C5O18_07935 [Amnimonas aquatica]
MTSPEPRDPAADTRALRLRAENLLTACRGLWAGVLAWQAVQSVVMAPKGLPWEQVVAFWAFYSLPLLLFFPAVRDGQFRHMLWMTIVTAFYGLFTVVGIVASGKVGDLSLIEAGLILLLLGVSLAYLQVKRRLDSGK